MFKRTITAIILIALIVGIFLMGNAYVSILVKAIMLLGGLEIYLIKKDVWPKSFLVYIWMLLAMSYLSISLLTYVSIILVLNFGLAIFSEKITFHDIALVFLLILVLVLGVQALENILSFPIAVFAYVVIGTYATDTFAYLGGSLFGKHKLIERISPNKTIEGAVIGTLFSIALSLLFAYFYVDLNLNIILITSLVTPFVAQVGDLSFSLIKRTYNIKDFGFILPGHGGVLDRIDSILFTILVFNAILGHFM